MLKNIGRLLGGFFLLLMHTLGFYFALGTVAALVSVMTMPDVLWFALWSIPLILLIIGMLAPIRLVLRHKGKAGTRFDIAASIGTAGFCLILILLECYSPVGSGKCWW